MKGKTSNASKIAPKRLTRRQKKILEEALNRKNVEQMVEGYMNQDPDYGSPTRN